MSFDKKKRNVLWWLIKWISKNADCLCISVSFIMRIHEQASRR